MLHVQNAIPLETLAAIKAEILDGLAWLENQVGERVPYITVMRSEFDPAMRTTYERLVMLLNEVLSPQFPYRDSIAAAAGCSEIQYIMAYAREARNDGGASAHVGFHQDYPTFNKVSNIQDHFKPKRTVTCWIPLGEIDDETPSIEYLPARLNLEAFGALSQHALVGGAQVLVLALRQLVQSLLDLVHTVQRTHAGDGQGVAWHRHQFIRRSHRGLLRR